MASIIEGYTYDIFISYRQNDNKYDGWVTEFVDNLNKELEANIKDKISVYFDINPHDGLLETHSVDQSLKDKLKCLIFIPIISRTYCDPKSFAWQHEFVTFNKLAKEDQFGRDIKLASGNVTSRILPVKIHDLDPEDKTLLENELGGVLRCIEFIYKSAGVNRPLRAYEDHPQDNLNKTYYRDQINKVANAIKEIITAVKKYNQQDGKVPNEVIKAKPEKLKNLKTRIIAASIFVLALLILGYLLIPRLSKSSEPSDKSVAVLPFTDMSPQKDQEYFCDGMVDAILDHLFKVGDLKVIARTSSNRYKNTKLTLKEIAHELGVSALLEGSVQKIGNNVRITAQLIDPKTGFHLWSETYDKDLSDIFLIQSEVAQNVAKELKGTLVYMRTDVIKNVILTKSQIAYDYYLKGSDYSSKLETASAINMYTKAIKEDPSFAAAYAKRAGAYLRLFWFKFEGWQGNDLKAREDIKKGLELNPELPLLKIAQANYLYYVNRDYVNALKVIDRLKIESPNMADLYSLSSYVLRRQGKWEESISELKHAIQLDPFDATKIDGLAVTYQILRQYDNSFKCAKEGLSIFPDYKGRQGLSLPIEYNGFKSQIFDACLYKTADLQVVLKESGLNEEDVQYKVYYYTRQYNKLLDFVRKDTTFQSDQFTFQPKTFRFALIYYLNGNLSLCKTYADSTIKELNDKIKEDPKDDRFYATLGKSYAFLGDDKEAVRCGKKAIDLKPIELDAFQGIAKEQDLMEIYIFTGNYDEALDMMEHLLSIPSLLHVGDILLNPIFDNLRNLPRFQKIINSSHK